jgi:hypothetical protein
MNALPRSSAVWNEIDEWPLLKKSPTWPVSKVFAIYPAIDRDPSPERKPQ